MWLIPVYISGGFGGGGMGGGFDDDNMVSLRD